MHGGFVEGVTLSNLLTAEPHGRNPLLADALKRIGLAERTGRGIDRIFEGSLIYGKPVPDYSATTSVTLSLNALLVINTLKDSPKSKVIQLAEVTHLSESTTKSILDSYIECGIVDAYGSGRGRTYILSPKVYKTKEEKIGYVRQLDINESRYSELILNMAKTSKFISRADVIQLLHVDENKAYKLLKKLADKGLLEMVNKGRYAKYKLK